jgi:hypothetical protein
VSVEKRHEVVDVLQVAPPGIAVTKYCVTGAPLSAGAVHDTVAVADPRMATTSVGALGSVAGVIAADGTDAVELPTMFSATTLNVYCVPLVRPEISQLVEDVTHVRPSGVEVTV